jgi:hypothetical protein
MTEQARLTDVLERAIRGALSHAHTSLPGQVVSYDPVSNTASVQPSVKAEWTDSDGNSNYDTLPVIPNVPVSWPRGGGMVVRMPLDPGDHVWLVFSEASLTEWRTTGQMSEPRDTRRHSLGYPFAIPGAAPDTEPLSPADAAEVAAGALIVGEDGGDAILIGGALPGVRIGRTAVQSIALAPPLQAFMTAALSYLTASHAIVAAVPAAPTPAQTNALNTAFTVLQTAGGAPAVALVPSTLTKSE